MTDCEVNKSLVSDTKDDSEYTLLPATGLYDPRASDAGRALLQLFHDRTGGERLLKRSDFSPVDLKPFLVNIVIMDVVYGDDGLICDGIVRLMGSGLSAFYGEYTGRSILLHPSSSGERFIVGARMAVENQCSIIGTAMQAVPNRPLYQIATCMTPVVDEDGKVVQMLGHVQLFT